MVNVTRGKRLVNDAVDVGAGSHVCEDSLIRRRIETYQGCSSLLPS